MMDRFDNAGLIIITLEKLYINIYYWSYVLDTLKPDIYLIHLHHIKYTIIFYMNFVS